MSTEDRQAAQARLNDLLTILRGLPAQKDQLARLVEEAEALGRAIAAFHLEGIRFRIYNVDRLVQHPPVPLPVETTAIVADVRKHLEAAGFHTRSHQSPV
jgi:Ser/Thr protein kinase RdoA (MazF antagonist)